MSDKSRAERNAARDAEIRRMAADGCTNIQIAAHFGISDARVAQIKHGRDRSNERKGGGRPCVDAAAEVQAMQPVVQDRPPAGVRPRLRKAESGNWECSDGTVARAAKTKEAAYQRWLTAAIKHAMTLAPRAPTAPPPAAAAWPEPIELPRGPKSTRPLNRGKSFDIKASKPAPATREAPPEYAGVITVVPGTARRPALVLPQALRLNAARAAAVQKPIPSMASTSRSEWVE